MSDDFYSLSFTNNKNQEVNLSEYKGKVVLIVNTASKCGFTPQYKGLEELYQKYQSEGLVVLGFPCDQFGGQEPGTDEDIEQFCELNFGVSFPLSQKVNVNGLEAHPVFKKIRNDARGVLGSSRIKWNFTKFLIGKDGQVIKRFGSTTKPMAISDAIEKALSA